MAATTADLVRKFIELDEQKRTHEGALEKVKKQLALLETELMARFEHSGMQRLNVDGVTVYLHRQIWAKAANGDHVTATHALKEVGLGHMVEERFNAQTLSAWVRERKRETEEALRDDDPNHKPVVLAPEELRKVLGEPLTSALDISEKFSLRTRKES
jgi:hypothetical protein